VSDWLRAGLVLMGLLSGLVAILSGGRGEAAAPRLCLEVLDVGQGDALLLTLPGGRRWLVDGGGDPSGRVDVGQLRLLPALRRRGIDRLDRVFATHGDLDHTGGLHAVLDELEVGELWVPRRSGGSSGLRRLTSSAARLGTPVLSVADGDALVESAPTTARLLHPRPGWVDALSLDAHENNGSIVLLVGLGQVQMLLTGDVEAPAEDLLVQQGLPRAAILKVPHHGSRSSSTEGLLAAVDPLVAVAGAGRENHFGFPHASVSARYLRRGVPLLWTGRHGALRTCTDGWTVVVENAPDGRGWEPLRSWSPSEVSAWVERAQAERPPVRRPVVTKEVKRSSRPKRKRRTRRRSRSRRKAAAPTPSPEPTPTVLLDDRAWERRRKARRKPKPPWKR
jgi:beta-lactamase superfamily II metal-dependent hydrolase